MRRSVRVWCFVALIGFAAALAGAQSPRPAVIAGTVTDSVHKRPLANVRVNAMLLDAGTETTYTTLADGRGRFRFDGLTAGGYALTFASAFLDSIEFGGPARRVMVKEGQTVRANLGIPSGKTLRALACPGTRFRQHSGVLQGIIIDAESERRLAGADIAVAWSALSDPDPDVRKAARRKDADTERGVRVTTDSAGHYRLCGVPTDDWIVMQVQHGGHAGAPFSLIVADETGIVIRNLSFSRTGARILGANPDSANAGTATLAGVVRTPDGNLVERAEVAVLHTDSVARTNERGEFVIAGLPAGTQEVEARRVGYGFVRQLVELRSNRTVIANLRLEGVNLLDSMEIVATRLHYREFELHRKYSLDGKFLDDIELASFRGHVATVSEIISQMAGSSLSGRMVLGQGSGAHVPGCIVVRDRVVEPEVGDRMSGQQAFDLSKGGMLNTLRPDEVGAIEIYRDSFSAPMEYHVPVGRCLIVIWSKR